MGRVSKAWLGFSLLVAAASGHGLAVNFALDRVRAAALRGDFGEAGRLVRAAEKLAGPRPDALPMRAWIELSLHSPAAGDAYGRALRASPADASLWIGLALASAEQGDDQRADRAFEEAVSLAPWSPLAQKAGGAHALRRFRESGDPEFRGQAIRRLSAYLALLPAEQGSVNAWLWRSTRDADLIRACNRDLGASRHLDLAGFFTLKRAFGPAAAERRMAAGLSGKRPLRGERGNLLINGGWEHPLDRPDGGWEFFAGAGYRAERDPLVSHSGQASLRVRFAGIWSGIFDHVHQAVLLRPGQDYELTGFALDRSASGCGRMYLAVVADRPEGWGTLAVSKPLKPGPDWQALTVKFRLPPDVEAVQVILHGPSDAHAPGLCGTVWWDDLRLAPGPGKETSTDS